MKPFKPINKADITKTILEHYHSYKAKSLYDPNNDEDMKSMCRGLKYETGIEVSSFEYANTIMTKNLVNYKPL